ncbi:hypothetical protein EDB19DRAFT_1834748, partial [Suillus lakei]
MGNSSQLGVLKDGQVETELLHKARMRIAAQLSRCLESLSDNLTFKDTSISEYEIDQAALTIAHAMVNPMNVDWDVDRYGDKVKLSHPNWDGSATGEPERLKKYFPEAVLGKISVPTTIVDRNSKIIVIYLPNILSPSHLKRKVGKMMAILSQREGGDLGLRLVDPLVTSESYSLGKVQDWLAALKTSEVLWNVITAT